MNISTLLTFNMTTKALLDGTTAWTPPTLTFGETLTLALTFVEDSNGSTIPAAPTVTALQAAIGFVDLPPVGGEFALQIGSGASTSGNTTAVMPWNVGPVSLQIAINALAAVTGVYGQAVVVAANGSFLIKFPSYNGQPPLTIRSNTLFPVSFGVFNAWQVNGAWVQELRLTQAPLAYTDTSAAVLPPAPSVTQVQAGGSGGGATWDEIQSLYVPPNFAGTYYLTFDGARTAPLDVTDGASDIQAALQAVAPAGGTFNVTNPASYTAQIDFGGTMSGVSYSLLTVTVETAPPGNLTFTLNLGMGQMWAALRASSTGSITVPMQITLNFTDDFGDPEEATIYLPAVTIQKSLLFPELGTVPAIDWLNPPSPIDYIPFDADQVITGQQYYQAVIGNGSATSFAISHGLETEVVFVFVRQNASNGRQLVDGTDFSVVINNANEVTVTALTGAPATNAWAAYVMSAQTVGAFAAGLTVTIGQVDGLTAALAAIGSELATITALLPTAPPSVNASGSTTLVNITIPATAAMYPGAVPTANAALSPTGKLPRPGALFHSINTAASGIANGSFPLAAPTPGTVAIYKNGTGVAQLIDGGLGHASAYLAANGYVGTDGRQYYIVNQAGSTNSFFASDMEKVLFRVDINSSMLVAGSTLTLTFNLLLQMLQANTQAQYLLVIEEGSMPDVTSPSPVATNLQNVVWNTASPVLAQRVILSEVGVTHSFGMAVSLDATGMILTAQRQLYGNWLGGAQAPSAPAFAVRARLIQFDVDDTVANPKGTVYYQLTNGTAIIAT